MIPKKIHYCWFGGNPLPESVKACIASWKKYCPDYEILRWDESNYDITKNRYMQDAYHAKKWAFVSDYARLDILYQQGGLYFDTDVELIRPVDALLDCPMFCGWEANMEEGNFLAALGLGCGAEKGSPVLKAMLESYESLSFYNPDGSLNLAPCPGYQTAVLEDFGLDSSVCSLQRLPEVTVYPPDYFSPKNYYTGQLALTENTYSIHHYSASWFTEKQRKWLGYEQKLRKKFGPKRGDRICYSPPFLLVKYLHTEGVRGTWKRISGKWKK